MGKKRVFSESEIEDETREIIRNLKDNNTYLKSELYNLKSENESLKKQIKNLNQNQETYEKAIKYSKFIFYGSIFTNVAIFVGTIYYDYRS